MTALTEYIANRENLLPLSLMITLALLLVTFIVTQILAFMPLKEDEVFEKQMVVQELVKLRFDRKIQRTTEEKFKGARNKKSLPKRSHHKAKSRRRQVAKPKVNVATLVQDFNREKFISTRPQRRRHSVRHSRPQKSGITTEVAPPTNGITSNSLVVPVPARPATRPSGRKAETGSVNGTAVKVGDISPNIGNVSGLSGAAVGGPRGRLTTRGGANAGAGIVRISLPTGSGGNSEASIDLHALIKWMKAHPGLIPKLVAHEMGHQKGDLSSAVHFSLNNKRYTIFLSCNEVELLLRVCLVEGNDFILLKDNGIREKSHYLTVGDVVRQRGRIQSLISSRRAPGDRANQFYSIFWAWWKSVQ